MRLAARFGWPHTLSLTMKTATDQAARRPNLGELVVVDPGILGGDPVFRGTRVPVASLFEHLESDGSIEEFLENFPAVSREAVVAVITAAQDLTLERARR